MTSPWPHTHLYSRTIHGSFWGRKKNTHTQKFVIFTHFFYISFNLYLCCFFCLASTMMLTHYVHRSVHQKYAFKHNECGLCGLENPDPDGTSEHTFWTNIAQTKCTCHVSMDFRMHPIWLNWAICSSHTVPSFD